jgi:hypothetical protein
MWIHSAKFAGAEQGAPAVDGFYIEIMILSTDFLLDLSSLL